MNKMQKFMSRSDSQLSKAAVEQEITAQTHHEIGLIDKIKSHIRCAKSLGISLWQPASE